MYAISVDSPEQNQAMVDKLLLPFDLLSDPDGSAAIRPYGLWDANDSIARPSIVVVDRGGKVLYVYSGRDFADRPGDDAIFAAARGAEEVERRAQG